MTCVLPKRAAQMNLYMEEKATVEEVYNSELKTVPRC